MAQPPAHRQHPARAPTHRNAMHGQLPITAPGGFFVAASGGLGWGLPAAVGIALAEPGRRVVCLLGEGSAMYSIQALWTVAQLDLPVAFVVLGQPRLRGDEGARRRAGDQRPAGGGPAGPRTSRAVAAGLGCRSRRVERAARLDEALAAAFESSGPSLVSIAVDPALDALY
jgi:benzoylformate decarboxylase